MNIDWWKWGDIHPKHQRDFVVFHKKRDGFCEEQTDLKRESLRENVSLSQNVRKENVTDFVRRSKEKKIRGAGKKNLR